MPRYLVTLRHAETGETRQAAVEADDPPDASMSAEDDVNGDEGIMSPFDDVWFAEFCEPADDVPVPGRDR